MRTPSSSPSRARPEASGLEAAKPSKQVRSNEKPHSEASKKRLRAVAAHVGPALHVQPTSGKVVFAGDGESRSVGIGGVEQIVRIPQQPALVPKGYLGSWLRSREALEIWQWMLRKNALKQDFFLIGPPGSRRRQLAFAWCELMGKEVEYLPLSRDTTESDLKQRREIVGGSLLWSDQPPVRAARDGRVLILDGLEKAERNVLPTLNNLLENREMSLQDGTFLTSPERFDAIQDVAEANAAGLVRVHEDFRVIALGLPVPEFAGFPLDPPLRSRFQARRVGGHLPISEQLQELMDQYPDASEEVLQRLVAFADSIWQMLRAGNEMPGPKPWAFPDSGLASVCATLRRFPLESAAPLLHRCYPYTFLPDESAQACKDAMIGVDLKMPMGSVADPTSGGSVPVAAYRVVSVAGNVPGIAEFVFAPTADGATGTSKVSLPRGLEPPLLELPADVVDVPTQSATLAEALESISEGKFVCFVGPNGEGKTVLARRLASILGYGAENVHTLHAYKDMTSRELVQRRGTDEWGDTRWDPSPLLTAALTGGLCILDGLQRLRPDTLAVLQSLCSDGDLELPDGTRLVRHDRFSALAANSPPIVENSVGPTAPPAYIDLGQGRRLMAIHPSFRLLALASPPGQKASDQWLSSEILPLFAWHTVPLLSREERAVVLERRAPSPHLASVLRVAARLSAQAPKGADGASWRLSLRQMLRLARRVAKHPSALLGDVRRLCLVGFMPVAARTAFEAILRQELTEGAAHETFDDFDAAEQQGIKVRVEDNILDIGGCQLPISQTSDPRLVPQTKFFNIPRHLLRLREIMRDLSLGEKHLMLIGNQGTGKNKLIDNLLQLLKWEREYIQLHRDTTVSALTVQATLVDGKVVWEDSPLVQAVRHGRTLVVDEADKAPLEVVCILKGLVEDGEMTLSDGRRILRPSHSEGGKVPGRQPSMNPMKPHAEREGDDHIIWVHPNFKLFLLANRPGFPFQGNDLFRETGDVYAPHVVENPDMDSEVQLLQGYAPDVRVDVLRRLSSAFSELRAQVDEGLLTYPYSTRELVNISRHLQEYPNQSVGEALRDILDFERHDQHALTTLRTVLQRWGIPLDAGTRGVVQGSVEVAGERKLPPSVLAERWLLSRMDLIPRVQPLDITVRNSTYMLDLKSAIKLETPLAGRSARFTEELARWRLPLNTSMYEKEAVLDTVLLPGTSMLVLLLERTATGGISLLLQDLATSPAASGESASNSVGTAAPTCDRLEASFGLRSPMRPTTPIHLFTIDAHTFGLVSERRMYTVTLGGDEPTAKEMTLPASLFVTEEGKPRAELPTWNTSFAASGLILCWTPGEDFFAAIDARQPYARLLTLPGVAVSKVWPLTGEEVIIACRDGKMLHIDLSLRGNDCRISGVVVVPHADRTQQLALDDVTGAPVAPKEESVGSGGSMFLHEDDHTGTFLAPNIHAGSFNREVRAAFTRRPQMEHYGKDCFAATIWPRATTSAATKALQQAAVPNRKKLLTVTRSEEQQEEEWNLEVLDLDRGSLRVLEPAKLGAMLGSGEGSNPDPSTLSSEQAAQAAAKADKVAPLRGVELYGSKAVLTQANGWVRVVEISMEALADQRKLWQTMVGGASQGEAPERLELVVNGETVQEEDEEYEDMDNMADDDEDDGSSQLEAEIATLEAAASQLAEAEMKLEEAHRAMGKFEPATKESWSVGGAPEGENPSTPQVEESQVLEAIAASREATAAQVRAHVASTAFRGASRPALEKLQQEMLGLTPTVQQLLDIAASSGPEGILAKAQADATELQFRQRQSVGSQPKAASELEARARAESQAALSDAFASAIKGDPIAQRLARVAEAARKFAEAAKAQLASGAAAEARTQAARNLQAAAEAAAKRPSNSPNSSGETAEGDDDGDMGEQMFPGPGFRGVSGALQGFEAAEEKLAQALAGQSGSAGAASSELAAAAAALVEVVEGAADAVEGGGRGRPGSGKGNGRGSGKGSGKGSGSGRGAGSGKGGGKGRGGGRGGRGGGGAQLQSDKKGGYSEEQLQGKFDNVVKKVQEKAKQVADRQKTKEALNDLGTEQYDTALDAVSRQIKELRVVLETQEAKDREREWVANQATGELDDNRLVDGVTGEKLIYRRRMEPDKPMGHQQRKPKRLSFVMDVSASMSRFNGEDGRLDRMAQAVVMLMESLAGFDHKYCWNIVGHSGNGPELPFVEFGNPPKTRMQRASVVSAMTSAAGIAASGDSTVEAIEAAVKRVAAEEGDDYLVFVVSDANLGGYGITPDMLQKAMNADPKVTASAIFIAEKAAADMLSSALPTGRGYVCMDVEQLPNILKEIFARAAVSS